MEIPETLFFIIILMGISILISFYLKDIFNPLILLILPIGVGYILYVIFVSPHHIVSNETNRLYVISIVSFTFGFLWILFLPTVKLLAKANSRSETIINNFLRVRKKFLVIGLIGFLIGLLLSIQRGLSGPSTFYFNLRYANTIEHQSLGVSQYMVFFLHVFLLFMIISRGKIEINYKKFFLLMAIYLATTVFTMARTNILLGLSSLTSAYVLSNRYILKIKIKKKVLFYTIAIFLILSYLFAVGTKKDGYNFFLLYLAYPIVAFDTWILNTSIRANGAMSFGIFYKVLDVLNITEVPNIDLRVPTGEFNAFTFMSAPYLDFGVSGLFFIFLILGMAYGIIYKQVRNGKSNWIVFYSILTYPLIISFFEYQFHLTTYIYYALIILLIVNMRKRENDILTPSHMI